ncbi:hypothetical protein [Sorangium sp. So ce854]|uniref:hypothetical protein n=1 Tax=Sorangium sp. So ce854 TaxID=3133322 RepID=UPI003F5F6F0B
MAAAAPEGKTRPGQSAAAQRREGLDVAGGTLAPGGPTGRAGSAARLAARSAAP